MRYFLTQPFDDRSNILMTMRKEDDRYSVFDWTVDDQMLVDWETTKTGTEIGARRSRLWKRREVKSFLLYLFNEIETALTALVLFNDVTGYAQKTGLALVCPADLWHLSSIPQFVVFINYLLTHRDKVGLLEFPVPKLGK